MLSQEEWSGRQRACREEAVRGLRESVHDEIARLERQQEPHRRGDTLSYLYNLLTRKLEQLGRRYEALAELRAYEDLMQRLQPHDGAGSDRQELAGRKARLEAAEKSEWGGSPRR